MKGMWKADARQYDANEQYAAFFAYGRRIRRILL